MTRRRPQAAAALALVLAGSLAAGACKKESEPAPAAKPAPISELELARGRDACGAYVEQVCACAKTVPGAEKPCALAKALPEAIEVAVDVSAHPDTERKDAVQSAAAIRKAIARCIEHAARLPELGCPPAAPARR